MGSKADVEMGKLPVAKVQASDVAGEGGSTVVRQAGWLALWMLNNIGVTMLNKAAFAQVDFRFPYALSTVHMACNVIGTQAFFALSDQQKPKQLDGSQWKMILFFSLLFSLNIAIGNVSIFVATIAFNQVFRSLVPGIVMVMSIVFFGKVVSSKRKYTVCYIVVGVALASFGDLTFSYVGLFFTSLCVLLAALKVLMSNHLLTGDLKLHPVDLLSKMCPLALLQIGLLSVATGEVGEIIRRFDTLLESGAFEVVLLSGIVSFSLNLLSLQANKMTSALTLCIAANVKQVLLIVVGTMYFNTPVTLTNALGTVIVLAASTRYSILGVTEQLSRPGS